MPEGDKSASRSQAPVGWRTRGYLPHFDFPNVVQHVIFRLADAMPARVMTAVEREPVERRQAMIEESLDAGRGACLLAQPAIAGIVEGALLHFDAERYRLFAWCVMPNHVHVLAEQMQQFTLSEVVHSWKSFSAQAANKALKRSKPFWAPEYYDRYMRDDAQFERTKAHIENNPVAAGLCAASQDWRFSSASKGR